MSLADDVTKKYMQDNTHFADLFNYYIYDGKPVINPDDLIDKDPTELCILSNGKKAFSKQKIRDILKSCSIKTDGHTVFVLMGIENQSDIHYAMTIKNLLYDALNYAEQADVITKKHRADKDIEGDEFLSGFAKTDTVTPVVTITLYWGTKTWDAATRLSDMFPADTPDEIRALATDYKLNLVTPENISDFRKLNTELGDMLESIRRCDDSEMFKNMIAERNGHWIKMYPIRWTFKTKGIGCLA